MPMDNFEKAEILGGISWLHILSCIYIISCFTNVAIACFLSFVNMIQNIRATPMFVYSTDGQSCPALHNSSLSSEFFKVFEESTRKFLKYFSFLAFYTVVINKRLYFHSTTNHLNQRIQNKLWGFFSKLFAKLEIVLTVRWEF